MTDNTVNYAGNFTDAKLQEITVILDEGAITVGTGYNDVGRTIKTYNAATPIDERAWVGLSNGVENTFAAAGGNVIVERAVTAEALTFIQLTGTPEPPAKFPANTAAADTLAKRVAGRFLRTCRAKVWGALGVQKATVTCNGVNATVPGVGTTLKFYIDAAYPGEGLQLDQVASGGSGLIPLHYVPAGTNGDKYSCAVAITGPLTAIED